MVRFPDCDIVPQVEAVLQWASSFQLGHMNTKLFEMQGKWASRLLFEIEKKKPSIMQTHS